MYVILLLILYAVLYIEYTNVEDDYRTGDEYGNDGATVTDSCETIIDKTLELTHKARYMVNWRVSIILGVIGALGIWAFVYMCVPVWPKFYLTALIVFVVIYGFLNFSAFHLNGKFAECVEHNLELYKAKCRCIIN